MEIHKFEKLHESRERIKRERDREKNTYTSPRLALRRVLLLAEGRQFREAAVILSRLGPGVLQSVASEIPIDLLVESLPHSAHLIETLLTRLIALEVTPRPEIQCEAIAWRLVALLGSEQGLRTGSGRLAAALAHYRPQTRAAVDQFRRQLDEAVQGLGTHGLTADISGTLISLHAALKNEFHTHVEVYKQALHKLEEMSQVTITQDPASSSHQRLLSLSLPDVERRLIDNKSLLTIIDKPALRQLPSLVASLASRVECDKVVLACVGQIRRADGGLDLNDNRPVAGVLMNYSRGCDAALSLMSTECDPPSPPPRASTDCSSDGYHSDSDDHCSGVNDRSKLISQYASVWALAAEETIPALAALEPLKQVPHLKYKIVFSVAVLSFRAAISLRDRRLAEMKALLCASEGTETTTRLMAAATRVLQESADNYPLGEVERTVVNQVSNTLREYPCLWSCGAVRALCAAAARAAWPLCLAPAPLRLHTDFTPVLIDPDKHVRFSTSQAKDRTSDLIKSFVWPALMDGPRCVFRAVVIT